MNAFNFPIFLVKNLSKSSQILFKLVRSCEKILKISYYFLKNFGKIWNAKTIKFNLLDFLKFYRKISF